MIAFINLWGGGIQFVTAAVQKVVNNTQEMHNISSTEILKILNRKNTKYKGNEMRNEQCGGTAQVLRQDGTSYSYVNVRQLLLVCESLRFQYITLWTLNHAIARNYDNIRLFLAKA